MAYEIPCFEHTFVAGADLSAKQFYAVKLDSNGAIVLAGAGENAIGVLQEDVASGYYGNVMILGITKGICGNTVTAGNNVSADASGKFIPTAGDAAAIGVALASGSANDIIPIVLVTRTATGTNSGTILAIPINLATVANGDIVTGIVPGISGNIVKVQFLVTTPVTTASKATTLNLEIGTTNLTGGVVSLTSANCATLGAVIAGTAVTANNTLAAASAISVEASGTTAFAEGAGVLYITIQ